MRCCCALPMHYRRGIASGIRKSLRARPGQPIIANIPSIRSFIAGDMIFGIGMAVLLVGFSIWGVSRVLTIQSQQRGSTVRSIHLGCVAGIA